MIAADDVIASLELEPDPEGGWYKETWREQSSTAIYYLLRAGERSHWHRVDATEVWHYYAGSPMGLATSPDGQQALHHVLGTDLAAGQRPQAVVPAGVWQAARPRGEWSLVGCTVAPAFRFEGFELAPEGWHPGRSARAFDMFADDPCWGVRSRRANGCRRCAAPSWPTPTSSSWPRSIRSTPHPRDRGARSPRVGRHRGAGTAGAEVAVDFTHIDAARANLAWCAANGVHAVVGTSGFSAADYDDLSARFTRSNCLVAPNFAIGAVLMTRFAELAAPYFDSAEIIELHHDRKIDAPSGTAVHTAERMAARSSEWAADPTTKVVIDGARGGGGPAGIRIHSVRLRGMVAHQEVLLGTTGQSLSIRHDSYDRESFMPGVVLAVKAVASRPGVTVGLDALLDI